MAEAWRRYGEGASAAMIARALGFAAPSVAEFIRNAGGIRPKPRDRATWARSAVAVAEGVKRLWSTVAPWAVSTVRAQPYSTCAPT
jgi:hypothetical protein